jgi:hypothetical protein
MPGAKHHLILDLPTPLTRRRIQMRILAMLGVGVLVVAPMLLLSRTQRTPDASGPHLATAAAAPSVHVSQMIVVEPSARTPLPIHIVPAGQISSASWIRVSGLPLLASLSEGHALAPGLWKVPVPRLPSLEITAPSGDNIRSYVDIALISPDGTLVAEARSLFAVLPASLLAPKSTVPVGSLRAGTDAVCPPWAFPRASPESAADGQTESRFAQENAERAQRLTKFGDGAMAQGNLAAARSFYERAAAFGWSQAAFGLAAAYDPYELPRWSGAVTGADAKLARCWYQRARELADTQAAFYLMRLNPSPGQGSAVRNAQNVTAGDGR